MAYGTTRHFSIVISACYEDLSRLGGISVIGFILWQTGNTAQPVDDGRRNLVMGTISLSA
jgi:hypothetical protein